MQTEILRLLSKNNEPTSRETKVVPDAKALFSLPSSLRKTMLALYELGEATAEKLSTRTGRFRGMESSYANELVRMGYLKKRRAGRKVLFYIRNSHAER